MGRQPYLVWKLYASFACLELLFIKNHCGDLSRKTFPELSEYPLSNAICFLHSLYQHQQSSIRVEILLTRVTSALSPASGIQDALSKHWFNEQ